MADDAKPSLSDRIRSKLAFSLAAWVTTLVGVLLILIAIMTWAVYSLDPLRIAWGDYMTVGRGAGFMVLWLLTCAATYVTVRVWMHEVPIGDRQIRDGWDAGIRLLADHGKRITDLPCFVVLGCQTRHQQDQWFGVLGHGTASTESTVSPAIDWRLNEDCLLVFCRDAGVYGNFLQSVPADTHRRSGQMIANEPPATRAVPAEIPSPAETSPDGTPAVESNDRPADTRHGDAGHQGTGDSPTMPAGQVALVTKPTARQKPGPANEPDTATHEDVLRTLDRADALVADAQQLRTVPQDFTPLPESPSSVQTTASQTRLIEFCERLRSARFPHSPINGTLVMVDSKILEHDVGSVRRVATAIRSDLDLMQQELGVSSPMTMAITEQDCHRQYAELRRRWSVGDEAGSPLLGRVFSPQAFPTESAMNGLADQAISKIQSQINRHLRRFDAADRSENHQLIRILIRCRRWRAKLAHLLVQACAPDPTTGNDPGEVSAQMISGVFAASPSAAGTSGSRDEGPDFVGAVIRRMVAQQNHLAWTPQTRARETIQSRLVIALAVISAALVVALLVQLYIAQRT